MIKVQKEYYTEGKVIGYDWYNNLVTYPAAQIYAGTYPELVQKISERYKDGSLDSGFGFQKLTGYELEIFVTSTVMVDGLAYKRTDWDHTLTKNENEQVLTA